MTREEIIQRRIDIYDMRESGMKYKDIAAIYKVTPARIRQIYEKQKWIYERWSRTGWRYLE